jgi:DNA-binding NarL/FixJ family response regulator
MIRILIAENSLALRDGLGSFLDGRPEFQVVGTTGHGVEVITAAENLLPDVVIMDPRMPGINGVEATERIKSSGHPVGVLFFSDSVDYLGESVTAGADGFLLKDCSSEELVASVIQVACSIKRTREAERPDC